MISLQIIKCAGISEQRWVISIWTVNSEFDRHFLWHLSHSLKSHSVCEFISNFWYLCKSQSVLEHLRCAILIWAVRSKFGRQFYHICGRLYYQNLCVNFDISANHKLCRNIWAEMCSLNMNCHFRVWKIIFITFVSDLMIIIWMQVVSYHFDVTLTLTKCADSPEENILWYSFS